MRPGVVAAGLILLTTLPACGQDAPSKSQAASILLQSLRGQCNVDSERFNRNDGYPFDRFRAFFNSTILSHPDQYPRQGPQASNAEFGGTFGETGEAIPLTFTIQAFWPGPYETGTISYCPWYTTAVQIYDITVVGPKEAKVSYGQTKTMTKLAGDIVSSGVIARVPPANVAMQEALFRRYDSLGWRLDGQQGS